MANSAIGQRRECPKRAAAGATYPLLHVVSKNAEYIEDTSSGVKGVCKENEGVDLQKGVILLPCHGVYPTVRGRLHSCITFWREELCVLDILRQGYVLPFTSVPTPYFRPNQRSAHAEAEFVDGAVAELVAGGYVRKVEQKPIVNWEENQLADYLSRIVDYDDWYLTQYIYHVRQIMGSPHGWIGLLTTVIPNYHALTPTMIVRQWMLLQCTGVGKTTGGAHHHPLSPGP